MADARSVVITGSTRGIGAGLADAFLAEGCQVLVNGRTPETVDAAVERLRAKHPTRRVAGAAVDASDAAGAEALWRAASEQLGRVDIWINNAGLGAPQVPLREQPQQVVDSLMKINFAGAVHCTLVAAREMTRQGSGQIFNMEGFGSRFGMMRTGMSVYGATKAAIRYSSLSVAKEQEGTGVRVGTLVPGVVVTEMLVQQYDGLPAAVWEKARNFYNRIGDEVETVAPVLARGVLANRKNGATVAYLGPGGMIWRMLSPAYRKRDLFSGPGRTPRAAA